MKEVIIHIRIRNFIGSMKIRLLNLKIRFLRTDMNQHFSQFCNFDGNNSIQIFILICLLLGWAKNSGKSFTIIVTRNGIAYRITSALSIGFQKFRSKHMVSANYGLFLFIQNFLNGRRFESLNDSEEACEEFFIWMSAWYLQ